MTAILIEIVALSTVIRGSVQGLEDFEDKSTSRDHPNYAIIEIGQNTEKCPGN